MGSHVNENEKNRKNLNIENFEKRKKKWSGDMVDRELPTKYGLDPWSGFREKFTRKVYGRTPAPRQ